MINKYLLGAFNIAISYLLVIILLIGLKVIKYSNFYLVLIIYLLLLGLTITFYFSKSIYRYNFGQFLMFLINIIMVFNIYQINNRYDYIENIFTKDYKFETYNLYVLKNTYTYSDISKLENKKVGILESNRENQVFILNYYNIDNIVYFSTEKDMLDSILNGDIQSFLLDNNINVNNNKLRIIEDVIIKQNNV